MADPGKYFQEFMSEKLLSLLQDRPCLELIIISSNFQSFALLAGQTTRISLKAINCSKKSLNISGPLLSRITSVINVARTVYELSLSFAVFDQNLPPQSLHSQFELSDRVMAYSCPCSSVSMAKLDAALLSQINLDNDGVNIAPGQLTLRELPPSPCKHVPH